MEGRQIQARYPFLISVPHGGTGIPPEIASRINFGAKDILFEGDPLTRKIYNFNDRVEAYIDTDISRIVVDLNRAPYDLPPANPDGVIKEATSCGTRVFKKEAFPENKLITTLLDRYYYPYHHRINDYLDQLPIVLCFDCHSMVPRSPPEYPDSGRERPLICLSNNGDSQGRATGVRQLPTCPPSWIQGLAASLSEEFGEWGEIGINRPFTGGFIIRSHYRQKRVPWIQIEINRDLYETGTYHRLDTHWVKDELLETLRTRLFAAFTRFWDELPEMEQEKALNQ